MSKKEKKWNGQCSWYATLWDFFSSYDQSVSNFPFLDDCVNPVARELVLRRGQFSGRRPSANAPRVTALQLVICAWTLYLCFLLMKKHVNRRVFVKRSATLSESNTAWWDKICRQKFSCIDKQNLLTAIQHLIVKLQRTPMIVSAANTSLVRPFQFIWPIHQQLSSSSVRQWRRFGCRSLRRFYQLPLHPVKQNSQPDLV